MNFGIMFHHFHDEVHPRIPGSLSAEELDTIIKKVGRENILDPQEWMELANKPVKGAKKNCITFDDSLLSQYEIAKPVLDSHGIKAFWFVYTSILEQSYELFEIYRYFRSLNFKTTDDFYAEFFQKMESLGEWEGELSSTPERVMTDYLSEFSFYSENDRKFRYIRDKILLKGNYDRVMMEMMKNHDFVPSKVSEKIWFQKNHLKSLQDEGHTLGLHSHTHPTRLGDLSADEQRVEYGKNKEAIETVTGGKVHTASHPSNSYSDDTLDILADLGIQYAFRANADMSPYSNLELPRLDHKMLEIN